MEQSVPLYYFFFFQFSCFCFHIYPLEAAVTSRCYDNFTRSDVVLANALCLQMWRCCGFMRRISTRMSLEYCLVFLHQRQNIFDIKANIILSDSKASMPILCCLCDQVRCADMVAGITRHAVLQWLVIFEKYCGFDTMKSMQFETFRNGLFSFFFFLFLFFFNLSLGRVPWHGIRRQVLQTAVDQYVVK